MNGLSLVAGVRAMPAQDDWQEWQIVIGTYSI